ncbi:hypothetical protein B0T44_13640 [Nocardia donostiensis]|uniref:Enoyl-CoA hydratase n=1 Tax=Nocardia donostiensis TaxID=1538463 RepID=A0A1W0BAX8_9NOCA|nr:hypothetical protein B0T46_21115 [Nocardia donostiensis]OQS16414.1 hypothetical protein B0T36_05515 [Nocardia donostiensis]OQS19665.1 hypothetical protein B0T44_13640 [Nocardia donostiensis]
MLRSRDGAVLILTINRPSKRNALDDHARRELAGQLEAARADHGIRAIVLSGSGGFFCAGADIGAMARQPDAAQARMTMLTRLARAIVHCPKPVIAAVEGGASGLGLSLAAACDHVIAAENARFTASFGRLGLVGDTGLFWSLAGRLGPARARQFLLFGESVAAPEAADIGIVNETVGPGDAQRIALARAERLAEASAPMLAATKRILANPRQDLDSLLAAEADAQIALLTSSDFEEGRRAFFERRNPVFIDHPPP